MLNEQNWLLVYLKVQSYMFFLRFITILFQEIKAGIKNPEKLIYSFSGNNHQ